MYFSKCFFFILAIMISLESAIAKAETEESEETEEDEREAQEEEEEPTRHHQRQDHGDGYSYYEFSGPVSGLSQPIYVPDENEDKIIDYYAQPDYKFAYGVADERNGIGHDHQESRQGDSVNGRYSLLQADGITRIVTYRADPLRGFEAVVEYHH